MHPYRSLLFLFLYDNEGNLRVKDSNDISEIEKFKKGYFDAFKQYPRAEDYKEANTKGNKMFNKLKNILKNGWLEYYKALSKVASLIF